MKLATIMFCAFVTGTAGAQTDGPEFFERLAEGSQATVRRCVGVCDCVEAPFSGPIEGTARLLLVKNGPMFDEYRVIHVNTVAHFERPNKSDGSFVGEGTYRIGGEFMLMHEMNLNLAAGDGPIRRYESGLVQAGSAQFPSIHITVRTNEDFCTQYVLELRLVTTCVADFDGDGFVTGTDFDAYVRAFEGGSIAADFDTDGFVTGIDHDLYVEAFERPCEL